MSASGPMLADLVRGSGLRGAAPSALSPAVCARAGRALGTLVRQREGGGSKRVLVARTHDGAQLGIRDGLVRGLVLSGHQVIDIGACPQEVFAFAQGHVRADAAVLASTSEGAVHNLSFFIAGKPLVGEGLATLCQVGDEGNLCVGEGSLEIADVWPAFSARPRQTDPAATATEGAE